ncbi:NAD(P)-binding protein [Setomelanomma holmii]|uniref:NAD(P)-binding protein n=1 Tax=Setomelanomma holmii TaxID=210430 RepID=A0A9P4HBK5_9PLEO|nr:NAD(P)-binding protein [Setomelanomma holmii]
MSSNDKIITLITGANGGIGFELAAQLLADASNFILLGSRSVEKGESAVKDLQARDLPGSVELVQIDVTSDESIEAAAKQVKEKHGRIDALVNNAAIGDSFHASLPLSTCLQSAFHTNITGPAVVVEAFAPLLSASTHTPRIINVTSGAGSITLRSDTSNPHQTMKVVPYRVSKAALNMLTVCQWYEYREAGWKVFAFCPGFTESNLGPMNKVEHGAKPTSEGARPMVAILKGDRDVESGGYLKAEGQWPW